MKYVKFNNSYQVEDINGNLVVSDKGDAVTVPFEIFFKGIVLTDDRWGKNIKGLNMLMDLRDKVKALSSNDNQTDKILELTDEEWDKCSVIIEEPQNGFNIAVASAIFKHINDFKNASSTKLELA